MHGVTVHTVFWAPPGYAFGGAPQPGGHAYQQLIEQFFTDVGHDSGSASNIFSTLPQYSDASGAASYSISYDAASDAVSDTAPYPRASEQCTSPTGIVTCVTDASIQQELDRVIRTSDPSARGMHDLWFVFLPPNVDTCITGPVCGSLAFTGYHALSNFGAAGVIYAVAVDPVIGFGLQAPAGSDPQGNPDAEFTVNVAAHELAEAITDPQGNGWLDANGQEIGDKCHNTLDAPLGYAANGAPYNQLINGDEWLFQAMWSNASGGCVQASPSTKPAPTPPSVSLRQFSPVVSGNIGTPLGGISVRIQLSRAFLTVARARATTDASGSWHATLRSVTSRAVEAVGDDRDSLAIDYGKGGPPPEAIATGMSQASQGPGSTGWTLLDSGFQVNRHSISVFPCSGAGVLGLTINGAPTPPLIAACDGNSGIATVRTPRLGIRTSVSMTSIDNRAVSPDPSGALVELGIELGEPGSVSALGSVGPLSGSGMPMCTADLRSQRVSCSGLIRSARYSLSRRRGHAVARARAGQDGVAHFSGFPGTVVRGGDVMTLRNRVGRVLSILHVAHLRVDLTGNGTNVTGGSCQPLEYWGAPASAIPPGPYGPYGSLGVQGGSPQSFGVCPRRGGAAGLGGGSIAQTDDLSGGQTQTELPKVISTTPLNGELVYGQFAALVRVSFGQGSIAGMPVKLTITRAGSSRPVFKAPNVDTLGGVQVSGLAVGAYVAKWVGLDANGDTRTVQTRFVQER
jgi:hypothetical protein